MSIHSRVLGVGQDNTFAHRQVVIGIGIDIEHCPHCGGTMKIIAAILEPAVITKILAHLGLPTRAPPRAPARSFNLYETA